MVNLIPIDRPEDPRLEPYRQVRERDLVGRRGQFIAEGEVVLRRLLAQPRHRPQSLLLAQNRLSKLAPVLEELDPSTPVYVASQAVMDAVVGFPIHRGVLAIAAQGEPLDATALLGGLPAEACILVLVGIGNHDNMGGLFRNAAAFGAAAVLLDATCCDPLYRKAIRVSVGASLTVPFARLAPAAEVAGLLEEHGLTPFALTPAGSTRLADVRRPPRCALLLGPEGPGLPAALMARCHTIAIPMAAGFDSLNVGVAAAVALHHLMFDAPRSS